jgi:2-oxoglutarate dehydrogenase E2 component (dihydrolipoamide succinyltransferase)
MTARNIRTMADIRVPTLGESVTEATIGKWFKKPGDPVAVDEPLVELETDKVTIEVPAPAAGVLGEIAAKDGETVAVGALLGQIKEGEGAPQQDHGHPLGARIRRPTRPRPSTRRKRSRVRGRKPGEAGRRRAGCAVGTEAGGGNRRRCLDRSRLRQGRARNQGRHAGGDRACRRRSDARCPAGRSRAGACALARG